MNNDSEHPVKRPSQASAKTDPAVSLTRALRQLIDTAHQNSTEDMADQNIPMLYQMGQVETKQQQCLYHLEAVGKQLQALTANHKLLENAGRSNDLLGEQHYQKHVLEPLLRSLFPVFDLIQDAGKSSDNEQPQSEDLIQSVWAQLEQFLVNYDIHIIRHTSGQGLDPKVMKPMKWTLTTDQTLHRRVCESLQIGFRRGQERILRHESVSLYKFQADETKSNSSIERIELC